MYSCSFCGFTSDDLSDFEVDEQFHKGFWCPDCDGFTYFQNEEKHRFILMLEDASGITPAETHNKLRFKTQVSPLRYPGGKSKFIAPILSRCRKENMVTFVEPFAGGASVGLSLLLSGNIENLYLNDADYGVYALYHTIKHCPQTLIGRIQSFKPSKEEFLSAQAYVLSGFKNVEIKDAAWYTLVTNRLAFSGISKACCKGNPADRWNSDTLCKRILDIHAKSDHLFISNLDACEFIEEMYWKNNTTIFIDPPYYVKGKDLYNVYYNKDDHKKLAGLLDDLHKGMPGADMVITYDYCREIDDMYDYPRKEIVNRKYCIAN